MTVSEITLAEVKNRLRIDYDTDDTTVSALMAAARAMIRDRTGRTDAEIDEFPQAYHLFMCICQHMYDSNDLTCSDTHLDRAAQCIINQMMTAEVVLA
jgi:uncharacterized phage protein (predicted DNA packaging)